jgi:hypothetical protein
METDALDPQALIDELNLDCAKAAKLRQQIKTLETELEPVNKRIIAGCFASGKTDHVIEGWKANIENRVTRTISAAKLIARGVSADVIAESTDVTTSEPFVKFYAIKAKS